MIVRLHLRLSRVVEDYAEHFGGDRSEYDSRRGVAEIYAIDRPRTLDRTLMNCEDDGISLTQRYDDWPRLHAWSLLRQHKFTTSEILLRFRQQDC